MSKSKTIEIRQNFPMDSENGLNQLVNSCLDVNFMLFSMSYYFERQDKGLSGFSCFFHRKAKSGQFYVKKILNYINTRGGKIEFDDIQKPSRDEWGTGIEALQVCLESLKKFYESLNEVDKTAIDNKDFHLSSFLEKEIMGCLLINIKLVSTVITDLQRASPTGMGEYEVNKELHRRYSVFSVKNYNIIDEVLLSDYEGYHHQAGFMHQKLQAVRELVTVISKIISTGSVDTIQSILKRFS